MIGDQLTVSIDDNTNVVGEKIFKKFFFRKETNSFCIFGITFRGIVSFAFVLFESLILLQNNKPDDHASYVSRLHQTSASLSFPQKQLVVAPSAGLRDWTSTGFSLPSILIISDSTAGKSKRTQALFFGFGNLY